MRFNMYDTRLPAFCQGRRLLKNKKVDWMMSDTVLPEIKRKYYNQNKSLGTNRMDYISKYTKSRLQTEPRLYMCF